jgi:hypothetical protein
MQSFSRGWSFLKEAWSMAFKDKDLIKPSIMALFAGFIVSIIFIPLMIGAGFLSGGDNSLFGRIILFILGALMIFILGRVHLFSHDHLPYLWLPSRRRRSNV